LFLARYAKNIHKDTAPTASFTYSLNNYTISLTDTSTNETSFPSNAVTVNWGDGKSMRVNAGATVSHTYSNAKKYIISFTVKGAGGLISSKKITVTVPQRFSIIVNLDTALPDGKSANFVLKKKGITKAKGKGPASHTFSKLKPGTYQIQISKSGYTFDGDAVTEGDQNPVTVIVGPDQTVTFTHTP
jgi:PKD repeat protein